MACGDLSIRFNSGEGKRSSSCRESSADTRSVAYSCTWQVCQNVPHSRPTNPTWQSVDILFRRESPSARTAWPGNPTDVNVLITCTEGELHATAETLGSSAALQFLLQCVSATKTSVGREGTLAKLLVPCKQGRVARSDIVVLRLVDCQFAELVTDFAEPRQSFARNPIEPTPFQRLEEVFSASCAGILLRQDQKNASIESRSLALEDELLNRLSFPWILDYPEARQTLAIVEGSRTHPVNGGTGPSIYLAAKALGINMIVLDSAGHWLEGPEYAHWRHAFIPTKLVDPPDPDFSGRIVKSIQQYGGNVDGIVTFCDSYMSHVAIAAQRLGLPTSAPQAYDVATDKYKTSIFEKHAAYRASGVEETMKIAMETQLDYPIIIKPCNSWSSEGVFRVDQLSELETAVRSIDTARHGKDIVIEPYCNGPEVDANFVLLDGEVLFFEICDDCPKSADVNGTGSLGTFIELDSVFPSALPQCEIDLLRNAFHQSLLRLGLRNGIMHLEGRIRNSSKEYSTVEGITDLNPCQSLSDDKPSPWLIEINPRPPGMKGTQVIESTHGIDYWGLAMLLALGDRDRAQALSDPFMNGPQYTCVMVFIPADYPLDGCEGVFDSDDICVDLMQRRPDLRAHVSKCGCLVQRGQRVPHPSTGVNSFLAYFNVFSRSSRTEALKLAQQVRAEVKFVFK